MGMIKKEASGMGDELKLVKNGKSAPKTAIGGTHRTSFKGSNDSRPAGPANAGKGLKSTEGYINQGPVNSDLSENHGAKHVKGGPKGRTSNKMVMAASENVMSGMGGKFIK